MIEQLEQRALDLLRTGFRRAGQTNLYHREGVVAENADDRFHIHWPADLFVSSDRIFGVHHYLRAAGSKITQRYYFTTDDGGDAYELSTSNVGNSRAYLPRYYVLDKIRTAFHIRHIQRKPLIRQLRENGFEVLEETDEHNVLSYQNNPHYAQRTIAVFEHGNLVAFTDDKQRTEYENVLRESTRLVDFTHIPLREITFGDVLEMPPDHPVQVLAFQDDEKEFGLSAYYNGMLAPRMSKLLREYTEEDLGIVREQTYLQDDSFRVGGANDTSIILQRLQSLNGVPLSELEFQMKRTMTPYLLMDADLRLQLARDNDLVHSYGLSHQQLAEPLAYAAALHTKVGTPFSRALQYFYRGDWYRTGWRVSMGGVMSPFRDGTSSGTIFSVRNLRTGKSLRAATHLSPPMAQKYGFYQGEGTRYRLNPQDVIDTFNLAQ